MGEEVATKETMTQLIDWEDPSNGRYLESHRLVVYLEDAVDQFLRLHPSEQAKSKIAMFLRDYFQSVRNGSHVLLREYSFITITPYNRACVIGLFWQTYRTLCSIEEIPTGNDYHSLLRLLWPEFPQSMVLRAVSRCLNGKEDSTLSCSLPFKEFLYAFQLVFCLQDFLEGVESHFKSKERDESLSNDVDSIRIPVGEIKAIAESKTADQCKSWWPSRKLLDDIFDDDAEEITMAELEEKLMDSERITTWIGKLPAKQDCDSKKIDEKETISDTVAISWPKTEQVSVRKPRLFSSRLSSVLREDSAGDSESDSSSGEPVVGRRFRSKSAGTGARSRSRRFK